MTRRFFLAGLTAAVVGRAESAVLECRADAGLKQPSGAERHSLREGFLLSFNPGPARGWALAKATLMLHVAEGGPPPWIDLVLLREPWREASAPPDVDWKKRKPLRQSVASKPDGWIAVELDTPLVELLLAGEQATGLALRGGVSRQDRWIHSRKATGFAPCLLVEGKPRR